MIAHEALFNFLKTGTHKVNVSNGLPEDAQFLRAGHDEMGNCYYVFCSEEWPELNVDERIQEHTPYFDLVEYKQEKDGPTQYIR